jgi:hypothetical protein
MKQNGFFYLDKLRIPKGGFSWNWSSDWKLTELSSIEGYELLRYGDMVQKYRMIQ